MSSSLTNGEIQAPRCAMTTTLCRAGAAVLAGWLLAGCIADTAEDNELPWATNKNWEGIVPIAPTLMDRYE